MGLQIREGLTFAKIFVTIISESWVERPPHPLSHGGLPGLSELDWLLDLCLPLLCWGSPRLSCRGREPPLESPSALNIWTSMTTLEVFL